MKRAHQHALADFGNLSAHGGINRRKNAEQFSFNDFPVLLDAEQIFNATSERSSELQCNRRGGRIMIRLQSGNGLLVIPAKSANCFRKSQGLAFLAKPVFQLNLKTLLDSFPAYPSILDIMSAIRYPAMLSRCRVARHK